MWLAGGVIVIGAAVGATVMLAGGAKANRPDLLLHTVDFVEMDFTVVERGALESTENRDVKCMVKATKGGNFATTIKWVIEDGSLVKQGQRICRLDDAALEDQRRTQIIAVSNAQAALIKAQADRDSAIKENEEALLKAINLKNGAELDVEKYVGLPRGTLAKLEQSKRREAYARELEKGLDSFLANHRTEFVQLDGEYQQLLDGVNGRIGTAEAEYEQWKDKAAYSQRMVIKGYVTQSQAQADESRLNSATVNLNGLRTEKRLLQTFVAQKAVQNFISLLKEADLAYDRTVIQTTGRAKFVEEDLKAKQQTLKQEVEKLADIDNQIQECRIDAPQDGMVVYYVSEQSRFGGGSQNSIVAQGEPVREGQNLMRIPNLQKMQVVARVHEAMISRIRSDEFESKGIADAFTAWAHFSRHVVPQLSILRSDAIEALNETIHKQDLNRISVGQPARVRVDAYSDTPLKGHVRSVATVASQDFFSSDVKVYQTVVEIDELPDFSGKAATSQKGPRRKGKDKTTGLRPGMSAEVTIEIDKPLESVLAVPVQAIIGGPELGDKRSIYVMTPDGPQEKPIRVGLSNDKYAEIREGLERGDQIVTNPKVIAGDKVKTRDPAAEAKEKGKGGKGGGKKQ